MGRHADPDPRHFWRSLAAAVLRATLALVLVVGLFAALASIGPGQSEDGPVMLGDPEQASPSPDRTRLPVVEADGTDRSEGPQAAPGETPADGAEPQPPSPLAPEGSPEDILAAAPPPEETTVQVLDGVGDSPQLEQLAAALEELGYAVVARNPSGTTYAVTTVLFTEGNEEAARALQDRDPRIVERLPNPGLSEQVDLHVVLGGDWQP